MKKCFEASFVNVIIKMRSVRNVHVNVTHEDEIIEECFYVNVTLEDDRMNEEMF